MGTAKAPSAALKVFLYLVLVASTTGFGLTFGGLLGGTLFQSHRGHGLGSIGTILVFGLFGGLVGFVSGILYALIRGRQWSPRMIAWRAAIFAALAGVVIVGIALLDRWGHW